MHVAIVYHQGNALRDLSEINYWQADYKTSLQYADEAIDILEISVANISDKKDRRLFIQQREDIYKIMKNTLRKLGMASSFSQRCAKMKAQSSYLPQQCSA